MDEESRLEEAERTVEAPKRKKKRRPGRVITIIVTVLLVAAAVLAFLYRDYLSSEGLRSVFGRTVETPEDVMRDWNYENGADQTFASVGDGLAVVSSSVMQLLDADGTTVYRQICSMDTPAVTANKTRALFYDVGGSVCRIASLDGSDAEIEPGGSLISASINASGYFAVISEETGSKGVARVYNAECELLYEWHSGTGYALKAQVCPDNRHLAVLCLTSEGSAIHIFRLNSEEEHALLTAPGELYFDMYFMDSSTLCIIGDGGMLFVGLDGGISGSYDFGDRFLNDYDFGSTDFAAVHLCDYRTGTAGTLLSFSAAGEILGEIQTQREITSLCANGRRLLVTGPDGLELYSQALQQQQSEDMLITAKRALLRTKGDVLLLSSYAAERFDF